MRDIHKVDDVSVMKIKERCGGKKIDISFKCYAIQIISVDIYLLILVYAVCLYECFYPNKSKFLLELKISVNEYLGVISADGKKTWKEYLTFITSF